MHLSNFASTFKLQELEVENGKMRDDLKKLRDALSDEAGEDNAQFKEMIGESAQIVYRVSIVNILFSSSQKEVSASRE